MSTDLSTYEILKQVLERIPVGESFEYTNIDAQIIKVSTKYIDIWTGPKIKALPRKVQAMIEVAEDLGYKVTYTRGVEPAEVVERPKKRVQVGLGAFFETKPKDSS